MDINIKKSEFGSLLVVFLYHHIFKGEIIENDEYNELIEDIKDIGLRPYIFQYYLDINSKDKSIYKRAIKSFSKNESINIRMKKG